MQGYLEGALRKRLDLGRAVLGLRFLVWGLGLGLLCHTGAPKSRRSLNPKTANPKVLISYCSDQSLHG